MKAPVILLALIAYLGLVCSPSQAQPPALTIQYQAPNVLISWPAEAAAEGYVLESAAAVTNAPWIVVPGVVTNSMVISPTPAAQFFRLDNALTNGVLLNGVVQSGGTSVTNPLAGLAVRLCEAGTNQPATLATATTDASGRFTLRSPKTVTPGIFFVSATIRSNTELLAVLGPKLPGKVTVNELTTVAAAYSMAQFYRGGSISGDLFSLNIGASMNDNLVDVATGGSSPVLLTSPNADETTSLRETRSLANLLAACVADPVVAGQFLQLALDPLLPPPATVPQAMANLARNPAQNVGQLYSLAMIKTPYRPALFSVPDAWTVAVKVNDSGDDNNLIGGVANIVFDAKGRAWISDNVTQGTPYSSQMLVVLQPNGKPADGQDGGPRSPIFTGGLLGSGFGITRDPQGSIWVGNFGWGPDHSCQYYPTNSPGCHGSVSQFAPNGDAVSGPLGYQGGPERVQGMASDAAGNIWLCSYGDDSVYVYLSGSPTNVAHFPEYAGSQPFDVQTGPDGTAWIGCGGGIAGEYQSSLTRVQLIGNQIQMLWRTNIGSATKGLAVDSKGIAWLTSQGDSKVYAVNTNGAVLGAFDGGGVNGPWGATADGDDNIWVANFGPLSPARYSARLSKLAGSNPATRPPGLNMGDPISPATGYTVPSAGSEVLLHNGTPLYGPNGPISYDPFQRSTASAIDQAGNLWIVNNWKNDFAIDTTSNPGGDGVLIFVGVATPPK
jgi:hypothetical protein